MNKALREEKELKYIVENPDKYISWREGVLIFQNEPIDKMVKKIEQVV